MTVTPPVATVRVRGTAQFTGVATGDAAGVAWRSSDARVATVDNTGLARGVAPGTAEITVLALRDTTARAKALITVTSP